jgi:hypothetical protein
MSYVDQYEEMRNAHYLGRGRVYFTPPLLPSGGVNTQAYGRIWGTNWPPSPDVPGQPRMPLGRYVGNARGLAVTPTLRRLTTSAWDARGNALVESVSASLTLYGHGAANLADALHGMRSQHAAAPMTEQIRTSGASIEAGGMLFVRHLVDIEQPMSVVPSWTTWTEGVHWRREAFGAELLAGVAGPIGSSVAITYTPEGSAESIDALVNVGLEVGVVYTGVNVVDGRMTRLELYRARPALDGAMGVLGDGIGSVALNFSIQPVRIREDRPVEWYRITRGEYPVH